MKQAWWKTEKGFGALCITPGLLLLAAVNIFPLLWLLAVSFTKFSFSRPKFDPVGFENYLRALTHPKAHEAILVTLKFVAAGLLIQIALGLALAVAVHSSGRLRGFLTTTLVFPMFISTAIAGLFWRFSLDTSNGVVNQILRTFGIGTATNPINWSDKDHAFWSIIIIDTWMWTPFVMLMATAALASVPKELYEAASVDRANAWTTFWRVTLPLISPVLAVSGMLRGLDLLKLFDVVAIFSAGGPGTSTTNAPYYIFQKGIQDGDIGRVGAFAILYLILINLLTRRLAGAMMGKPLELPQWASVSLVVVGSLFALWLFTWPVVLGIGLLLLGLQLFCQAPMKVRRLAASVVSISAGVVFLGPILLILLTSFKQRKDVFAQGIISGFQPTFENYQNLFGAGLGIATNYLGQLWNSLWIGIAATIITAAFGTIAAYAFSRFQMKSRDDLLFFILSTKMLPAVAVALPIVNIFRWFGLYNNPWGLVVLYSAMNLALAVWIMKAFIDKVPREYEEAAVMEQCTPAGAFRHAVLPALWPAILTTCLFCFLACWNEYAFGNFMSGTQQLTAPPAVTSVMGTGGVDWGYIAAASVIQLLPALILTIATRKTILLGVSFGSLDSK